VSNGIKFVFLLSVILIVMFSMTFAQDVPFNAEVIVETARMRWGPGPAYTVQHYANLGHVLTILEADTESNPPWTWYRARTPSGVESWIRGDLVRRATGAAARVDMPTGTFPVLENNLCNDDILFRRCQDGTDHDLWQAGYWANDRYDHWETGGWDLNIVYHNNPCKSDRLCTTREDWDAGAQEAALIVASLTPEATWTPVVIHVTSEVEVSTDWTTFNGANLQLTDSGNGAASIYTPPVEIKTQDDGSIIGGFRFNSESVSANCQYWHNADQDTQTDYVKSGVFGVNLGRFRVALDTKDRTEADRARALADSRVRCISGNIAESDIVARRWEITITRSYSGLGRIGNVSWRLAATFGADEPADACATAACTPTLTEALQAFIASEQPTDPRTPRTGLSGAIAAGTACSDSRMSTTDEVTRYEHKCEVTTGDLRHSLELKFTHDRTRGFLRPTPTATPDS